MFVNKTKTTLRAHTVDKNTSSVCRSKRRFRPKPHAPVLFLSIYRDTVPLSLSLCVSSHHLCRVMCTNEVGMSLEVVHTILSSQHVSRVVHANQVSMSLNTTPGADLDILLRGG